MDDSPARAPRPATDAPPAGDEPVRVWDLPLRLWHWALAAAVGTSLYTGLTGGFEEMDWHRTSGFVVLGLLLFRLAWGFVGPRHARFGDFLAGPRRVLEWSRAALRGAPPATAGHNPLAGWTIAALLLALAVQAVTGLFASDDLFVEGPLVHLVDDETVSLATSVHAWGQWTAGGLVALHLVALVVHRVAFGERLVGPMITGRRRGIAREDGIDGQRIPLALVLGAIAAGGVWWVVTRL